MSAPVSSFSKLSLSQAIMQSSTGGKGKGKQPARSEEEEEEFPSESEEEDDAPEHIYALSFCSFVDGAHEESPRPSLYAFQILDAEIVRYGVRVSESGLVCSCGRENACGHAEWLTEQLAGVTGTRGTEPDYYQQISTAGLQNITDRLHWELRHRDGDSQQLETIWRLRKDFRGKGFEPRTRERMRITRDILAALSMEPAEDYRRDIFDSDHDVTLQDDFVPNDLAATVTKLLVDDDGIFYKFKALVPPNIRALDYFRKMDLKAKRTFALLDDYVGGAVTAEQYDLIWCATQLVNIVNLIGRNIIERQPLSAAVRLEATKALVSILYEVVMKRNTDVYQNNLISRRIKHGEPLTDKNLYLRLIGSPSPQNPDGNAFVLDALEDLPEAQSFLPDLEKILKALRSVGWKAPPHYVEKLRNLIIKLGCTDNTAPNVDAGDSSGSRPGSRQGPSTGGKRAAGSDQSLDRKAKRMK